MPNAIASGQDPALQPVAARQVDAGIAAARRARDRGALEGTQAVGVVGPTDASAPPPPAPEPRPKGRLVDRSA